MANYNKSFNFRNGVQVDNDNFVVNSNGLVGIGTSIPTESLDVYGTAKIAGLVTATSIFTPNLNVSGVATITTLNAGIVTSSSGVTTYYGDGSKLSNLPTSQWVDVNIGLGFTSIYAAGNVGVATTNPGYTFQVGGNPNTQSGVGFNSTGNINATGIVTAGYFYGNGSSLTTLNASNILTGTLSNSRLPSDISVSGIVTATTKFSGDLTGNVTGNVTGIASTALSLSGTPNINVGFATATQFIGNVTGIASTALSLSGSPSITVTNINATNSGIITAAKLVSGISSVGVSTVSTRLYAESIGVGTNSPSSDIHIRRSSVSRLQVTSDTAEAIIAVGRSTTPNGSNGAIRFGNTSGLYPSSTTKSLDIINYDTGNLNYYLHYGATGVGTGNFNWLYGPDSSSISSPLMTLTYGGNLGIGITNPTSKLQVSGNVSVSSLNVSQNIVATGAGTSTSVRKLYVIDGSSGLLDSNGNQLISNIDNFNITSGVSTFFNIQVTNNGIFGQRIGIGNTNPLESLHIGGDYLITPEDALVINSSGIGIGTTSIRFGLGIDAAEVDTVFGTVGIGTTNVDNPLGTRLLVNGPARVISGDISVGTDQSYGLVLTSPNGTKYRLVVSNAGSLSTVLVP